jgi:hypothetical protein
MSIIPVPPYKQIAVAFMTPDELSKFCKDLEKTENKKNLRIITYCIEPEKLGVGVEAKLDGYWDNHFDLFKKSLKLGVLRKWKVSVTISKG